MGSRSSAEWAADYVELFGSITEDPNLQIAAAAALFTAVSYSLLTKSSQLLSPRLCKGYLNLKDHDKVDWNSRLPSTLHAVVVCALCIYALCYSGDYFDTAAAPGSSSSSLPVALRVSDVSYAIIGMSFGYFVMDGLLLLAHPELGSREMYVHHAVALLSLGVAAQVGCMHVYLMMMMLSELTTPFVNLRWLLDKADLKHVPLYTINGLLLLLVWGVARVVLYVPFYVHVATNWSTVKTIPLHALVLLLGVPLLLGVLNVFWFVKIVRGAYKLVFQRPTKQTAQQSASAGSHKLGQASAPGTVSIQAVAAGAGVKSEHVE